MFVCSLRRGICLFLCNSGAFRGFCLPSGPWDGTALSSQIRGRCNLTSRQRLVCVSVFCFVFFLWAHMSACLNNISYCSFVAPLVSTQGVTKSYFLSDAGADTSPTGALLTRNLKERLWRISITPLSRISVSHFKIIRIVVSQREMASLTCWHPTHSVVPGRIRN